MKGKKTSGRGDFEDTQSIPIDFGTFLSEDVSSSGSFYVNEVQTSSLGKLLQALPIPVLLIDKGYRIIFANHACERISPAYEKVLGAIFPSLSPIPLRQVKFNLWPQRSSQAENQSPSPSLGY
jgi:PAS domain-containing protein